MAVLFHKADSTLACDECGCMVDSSERGRVAHESWHNERDQVVVDLREIKTKVA